MTSSLDSRSLLYWIDGDALFEHPPSSTESRREDAAFATIAEVMPNRRGLYLDSMEREACLTMRQRRDIEAILSSPHRSDCAAAMEAQQALWEERKYRP